MALIEPTGPSPELLSQAAETLEHLRESAALFRELGQALKDGDETPARARDRVHDYRKAAVAAMEDGRRVADEINRARGIVHDYALDLAAARDEVERLLDRFAAEAGAGEVPRRAE